MVHRKASACGWVCAKFFRLRTELVGDGRGEVLECGVGGFGEFGADESRVGGVFVEGVAGGASAGLHAVGPETVFVDAEFAEVFGGVGAVHAHPLAVDEDLAAGGLDAKSELWSEEDFLAGGEADADESVLL